MSDVRNFGATGDGKTDDTKAILHALKDGDGILEFSPGQYVISSTIKVELDKVGRFGITGSQGTAKIINKAAGPAFHLLGTHAGRAHPESIKPNVWKNQRMPTITNIEIEGGNPKASGFLVERVMQVTFEGVLLRELHDGIRLYKRNRNVVISHCHIFHNRNVGIFLDRVDLHQIIIASSHISYNANSGIKIVGSDIFNLEITGNDIEYNYDGKKGNSAEIWIEANGPRNRLGEVTIASNTIQARYAPNGANIHIDGFHKETNHNAYHITITGNMIGNQEHAVRLKSCRCVVLSGNTMYGGYNRTLLAEDCKNLTVDGNSINHYRFGIRAGVHFSNCENVSLTGGSIQGLDKAGKSVDAARPGTYKGLVELVNCRRMNLAGVQILDGVPHGLYVENCHDVNVSGCTIMSTEDLDTGQQKLAKSAVRFVGKGSGNMLTGCRVAGGSKPMDIDPAANVTAANNVVGS